jgi:hypothetical protein
MSRKESPAKVQDLAVQTPTPLVADNIRGGLSFVFKVVQVKTVSWAHD